MTTTFNLDVIANAMDQSANEIGAAVQELHPDWGEEMTPQMVKTLSSLWRLEGYLTGMADAMRMVEVNDE